MILPNGYHIPGARQAVVWRAIQLNPHLVGTYSRDDYQRRLRKISPLDRDEMPAAWGADEPALFDALVKARAEVTEQARQRQLSKWRGIAERAEAKQRELEGKAQHEEDLALRHPKRSRLHLLRAEVKRAQAAVCAEEIRVAHDEIALLDTDTDVALLWTS